MSSSLFLCEECGLAPKRSQILSTSTKKKRRKGLFIMNMTWRDYPFVFLSIPLLIIALLIPNSALALGVSAVLALYAFFSPKNGLLILLLYFPTRPFLIEINPSLKMVGDLIILAAFAHVLWQQLKKKDYKGIFKFQIFEWAFFLFCGIGAISAYLTGVSLSAIVFQLRAFLITYIVYYVVKRLDIKKEDILKFLWTTFWMAIILCLHGIIEKISLRTWFMPIDWVARSLSHNNRVRIYGLIDNPNVLAVYLSLAFMLTLYLKNFVKGNWKLLINAGLLLMLGIITLTYSRGTWIGFVIALIVYVVMTKKWKFARNIAVAMVAAVLVINIPVTQATNFLKTLGVGENRPAESGPQDGLSDEERRIKETFELSTVELSKTSGRLFIVNKGFDIYKDHPIIGTGFATYGDSAAKSYSSPIYDDYGITFDIYSDNQYIQIIAQTGSVGVVLFAVFLLGMLFFIWKKRNDTLMAVPVLAVLLAVYACGLLYNIWEDKTYTTYFFMLLAGVYHTLNLKKVEWK